MQHFTFYASYFSFQISRKTFFIRGASRKDKHKCDVYGKVMNERFSAVARFASGRPLAMNWQNLSYADRQFWLGAHPQSPCYFEGGESPLRSQNSNSPWRHLFADPRLMLQMVLTYSCIESFIQVEHHVIYELHSINSSVAICATLNLRLIQFLLRYKHLDNFC